jgi:hypothetical protein
VLRGRVASSSLDIGALYAESAHDVAMRRERVRSALSAMSSLPEAQRRVLVEREFAGRGHREIASRLGRSEAAVRQLLNRARTQLRDRAAALVPFLVRLLPTAGEQPLVAGPTLARAGAVIAVAVAAAGGGAAVLGRAPASSKPAGVAHAHPRAGGAVRPAGAAAAGGRAAGASRFVTNPATGPRSGNSPRRATGRVATSHHGLQPTGTTAAGLLPQGSLASRTTTPGASPSISANTNGTAEQQGGAPNPPGATAGGGTGRVDASAPGDPQTASAPVDSSSPSGQPGPPTGQSDSAPAQSGAVPGQSGSAPGQTGSAPGHSGSAPGQSGSATGQAGSAPGQSGFAPGQSGSGGKATDLGHERLIGARGAFAASDRPPVRRRAER